MALTLDDLSIAERWIIARRRSGLNQKAYAKQEGVSERRLKRIEAGIDPIDFENTVRRIGPTESCFILRLRAGLTQEEAAAEMKITRVWFNKMERGLEPAASLHRFWRFRDERLAQELQPAD